MILYFACKLVEDSLIPSGIESGYFYPVIFPKKNDFQVSSFDIFLKTIGSYSKIEFSSVIFNLDLSEISNPQIDVIVERIKHLFGEESLVLRLSRPSNIIDWLEEINSFRNLIDFNEPALIALNHDHPFVDYNSQIFSEIVNQVFNNKNDPTGQVLYYSHAPELICWALNGRGREKYKKVERNLFSCQFGYNWVDSIGVMTMETFLQIWKKVRYNGSYIGRFDWKGVEFESLNLTTYIYPREFFRHFDGYNHTTGVRFTEPLSLNSNLPFEFPSNRNIDEIVSFYYQLWLANYLQFVESYLENNSFSLKAQKTILIEAIQKSMELFNSAYLDMDVKYGLLPNEQKNQVQLGLHNLIYYNANSIYRELKTDIQLKSNWLKSPLYRLKSLIYNLLKK